MLFSRYSYDIRYRSTTLHANADALSRIPLVMERRDEEIKDCAEYIVRPLEQLPVTVATLREATSREPVLAKVLQFVQTGWHSWFRKICRNNIRRTGLSYVGIYR